MSYISSLEPCDYIDFDQILDEYFDTMDRIPEGCSNCNSLKNVGEVRGQKPHIFENRSSAEKAICSVKVTGMAYATYKDDTGNIRFLAITNFYIG